MDKKFLIIKILYHKNLKFSSICSTILKDFTKGFKMLDFILNPIAGGKHGKKTRKVLDKIQKYLGQKCVDFKIHLTNYKGHAKSLVKSLIKKGATDIIVVGGDGTLRGAKDLSDNFGIKVMGIPCTIDNDLNYTDYTVGFDTAVNTVLWAINNLRDTFHSHDRVGLLEVMGRNCGDIALYAGVAGGAEYVLVPEIPYDLDKISSSIKKSYLRGKTSNMIILAEGAGNRDEIAEYVEKKTGIGVKVTNFGHIQRGGSPNMADRVLAARFGYKAVELLKDNQDSCAIGIKDNKIITVSYDDIAKAPKKFDNELYNIAHVLGL